MLIAGFPAGPWATNCWVAATGAGQECIVIDPGKDCEAPLAELLSTHNLKPVAVLLTHGHIDHMWSLYPVASGYNIPGFVHPADRHLLSDPTSGLSPEGQALVASVGGTFVEPDDVRLLTDNLEINVAGMQLTVAHNPGHTAGSVSFFTSDDQTPFMFSGDLLFQGAIGRTDLPGGNPAEMIKSLQKVVLGAADETVVHCGHGPSTTIAQEKRTNQYLSPDFLQRRNVHE
jgi:glyoxylase-like metal-dependent hydrolase (beta-lactamase superfamily II)